MRDKMTLSEDGFAEPMRDTLTHFRDVGATPSYSKANAQAPYGKRLMLFSSGRWQPLASLKLSLLLL